MNVAPASLAPDFSAARSYAVERLARELPPLLTYHSLAHTCEEVVQAARRLAALTGVSGESLLLLETAAYYHDIGFIESTVEHEQISMRIAGSALPQFHYSPAQIAAICAMIQATKLPQRPQNLLECILADADLDTLGRPRFLQRNRDLRQEQESLGRIVSDAEWYQEQIDFLANHRYWTAHARALRDPGKRRNLARIAQLHLRSSLRAITVSPRHDK